VKYKVGDDVVVVSDKSDCFYKLGDVGVVEDVDVVENIVKVLFKKNGKSWWVSEVELELVQAAEPKTIHDKLLQGISKISIGDQPAMIIPSNTPMKVKSSGGSSSYYFSKLPKEVIEDIVDKGGIELKDIVKYCFYNDADVKDITKAIKRIMEDLRGGGKEGIDAQYDLNKIKFFFNEFEKSVLIQKREQDSSYDR